HCVARDSERAKSSGAAGFLLVAPRRPARLLDQDRPYRPYMDRDERPPQGHASSIGGPELMRLLSYFHGIDPAAALIDDGRIAAYVEEERLVRNKHAAHQFPIRSIASCLSLAGVGLPDIDA